MAVAQDITERYALAERIIGGCTLPNDVMELFYKGDISAFESLSETGLIPDAIADEVWELLKPQVLPQMREFTIMAFMYAIFTKFNDEQVEEMFQQHIYQGSITDMEYSAYIFATFQLKGDSIKEDVMTEGKKMNKKILIPKMYALLKERGINLPEIK
jgi:hypothetical protein